ncbi:hypothetical protein JXC34_00600 [Candidatus Woesearchaeota archaeon]|nr:hypothetical protein [Candidatus Woesearchaeota archaeon]
MYVGFCDNHDSGVAVYDENRIRFAVNEERLDRKKLTSSFPKKSLDLIKKQAELPEGQTLFAASGFVPVFGARLVRDIFGENQLKKSHYSPLYNMNMIYQSCIKTAGLDFVERILNKAYLRSKTKKDISQVEHHLCHAASAYYTSGMKRSLIITMDGIGDGLSLTVNIGHEKKISRIYSESGFSGISSYYSRWTEYLGFKPNLHEGKIVGLAAYGTPRKNLLKIMKYLLYFDNGKFNKINYFCLPTSPSKKYPALKKYSKEDIAASVQKNFEEQITRFVEHWMEKTKIYDVSLAGGVFANVKLNQRIHEIKSLNSIYIFPNMGDGGLALGAILAQLKPNPFILENTYLGPEYSSDEIEECLRKHRLNYSKEKNIEKKIAELISKGNIVGRFAGRMEYGPRALGNRSILFRPDKPELCRKLNQNLKRTEFMPFAPTILRKHADRCLENVKGAENTSRFMNISFDCTTWMKKNCPAAVHVDGTSRPQLLDETDNPSYYNIITEFMNLSNLPCVINTSFNMHGEPIVCSPEDAVQTFIKAKLDYLAIGDFLVREASS